MDAYEKIIKTMREEGNRNPSPVPKLATMTGSRSCKLGTMELTEEDLLFCVTNLKAGDRVVVYRISNEKFLIIAKVVN